MKLYRLSRRKYAKDLSGTGAKLNGGRWNSKGNEAFYTAEHISLAKLEVAVHMNLDLIPDDYCLVELELPDNSKIQTLKISELPKHWDCIPYAKATQMIGDNFLYETRFLALKVPSAIVHQEHNVILNPQHPDYAKVKVLKVEEFRFDERLFN